MKNYEELIINMIATGAISTFGGTAFYFYQVSKGKPFKFTMFLIHLFLAFFVGYIVDQFLPITIEGRGGYISIAGFLSYRLFKLLYWDTIIHKIGIFLFTLFILNKYGKNYYFK